MNPEDNAVETAREGQQEILEVNINDGPKTIFGAGAGDNPLLGEGVVDKNEMIDEEVVEVKNVIRDENLNDIAVKDELKPEVVSPTNIVEEAALVPKTIEYIVDWDSD